MKAFLIRLKYRWLFLKHHDAELSRRVAVENLLFEMAAGKRPLPDQATCRWLALRLGTPKRYWSDALKSVPDSQQQ